MKYNVSYCSLKPKATCCIGLLTDATFEIEMLFETKHGTGWGQFDLTITTGNKVVKEDDSTERPLDSGEWMATWRYPAEPDWTPGNYTATVCTSLSLFLSLSIIQYVYSCVLPSLIIYSHLLPRMWEQAWYCI